MRRKAGNGPRGKRKALPHLIRLLGMVRVTDAFEELVTLVDGGRTLLGKRKLLPRSRDLIAAVAALATGWRNEPRALELLALAAVSGDADVRAATDPEAAES